jgi:hypothetical protein
LIAFWSCSMALEKGFDDEDCDIRKISYQKRSSL